MNIGSSKKEKPIEGITCAVYNCDYHDGKTRCTAPRITVGPSSATSSTDTICATFKPRQQ